MSAIVGRKSEIQVLNEAMQNNSPELIAVYGRRRIGKTFLIREYFKGNIVFEVTGLSDGSMKDQLENFAKAIFSNKGHLKTTNPEKWLEAFTLLEKYLDTLKSNKKKVVFIDEFPWIATPRSKFLIAFENFWNN